MDDDIVFVNISEFKCFVNYVHEMQDVLTVSANIVNNGVVAHMQQELGIVPSTLGRMEYAPGGMHGSLFESAAKCLKLHKYFLTHASNFRRPEIMRYKENLSINFIAYSGRRAKEIHQLVTADGRKDERAITTRANTKQGAISVVYMRLVVAHGTYEKQSLNNSNLGSEVIHLYEKATL